MWDANRVTVGEKVLCVEHITLWRGGVRNKRLGTMSVWAAVWAVMRSCKNRTRWLFYWDKMTTFHPSSYPLSYPPGHPPGYHNRLPHHRVKAVSQVLKSRQMKGSLCQSAELAQGSLGLCVSQACPEMCNLLCWASARGSLLLTLHD